MTLALQVLIQGAVGFAIGAGTNDLAIRWIFNTVFSKKKRAIAASVQEVVSKELMSADKIVARLASPKVHEALERDIRREIDDVCGRVEKVTSDFGGVFEPLIPGLVKEEVRAFARAGAVFNDEIRALLAKICVERVSAYLSLHMPRILEETDIWGVVYDSVISYDEKKMEFITRHIANRELRGVTLWGGVIGALVGVSMSFVMWLIG